MGNLVIEILTVMKIYKVLFNDNKPVASKLDGHSYKGSSEFDHFEGKLVIKSLEVIADSEPESMVIAEQFAKDCFRNRLLVLCN